MSNLQQQVDHIIDALLDITYYWAYIERITSSGKSEITRSHITKDKQITLCGLNLNNLSTRTTYVDEDISEYDNATDKTDCKRCFKIVDKNPERYFPSKLAANRIEYLKDPEKYVKRHPTNTSTSATG